LRAASFRAAEQPTARRAEDVTVGEALEGDDLVQCSHAEGLAREHYPFVNGAAAIVAITALRI
jgi:hypothetical protein